MPIPSPPPTPNRNDPANFSAYMDAYLAWLTGQAVPEINSLAINSAVNVYQEGTFTPVLEGTTTAGVGTYTTQAGRFTRIGNRVFIDVALHWTAHTGTGNMRIAGLPFTSASGSMRAVLNAEVQSFTIPAGAALSARVLPATTLLGLNTVPSGGGSLSPIAMDTSAECYVSGCYVV